MLQPIRESHTESKIHERALDAIGSDIAKRQRLSEFIERGIRADGNISKNEIERLKRVASYLGGQVAPQHGGQ
jgi:hypothetical protein